jgi:hypothetical protein
MSSALSISVSAAFCDMKYWRNLGGYKDDNLIDEMNYDGFLAEEMRELERINNVITPAKVIATRAGHGNMLGKKLLVKTALRINTVSRVRRNT